MLVGDEIQKAQEDQRSRDIDEDVAAHPAPLSGLHRGVNFPANRAILPHGLRRRFGLTAQKAVAAAVTPVRIIRQPAGQILDPTLAMRTVRMIGLAFGAQHRIQLLRPEKPIIARWRGRPLGGAGRGVGRGTASAERGESGARAPAGGGRGERPAQNAGNRALGRRRGVGARRTDWRGTRGGRARGHRRGGGRGERPAQNAGNRALGRRRGVGRGERPAQNAGNRALGRRRGVGAGDGQRRTRESGARAPAGVGARGAREFGPGGAGVPRAGPTSISAPGAARRRGSHRWPAARAHRRASDCRSLRPGRRR